MNIENIEDNDMSLSEMLHERAIYLQQEREYEEEMKAERDLIS